MLKKTTIAVLGLAASGLATAGAMGPVCTPGNVTVPCEARMWDLGAEALYLRSIYSGERSSFFLNPTGTAFNPALQDVRNDWDWGYRITGSYYFNTGNDVTVNWMHFRSTASQANILGPLPFPLFGTAVAPANFSNTSRLDQVNAVMGQHVDLGMRDKMRFYAGMQYANIQSNAQTNLTSPLIAFFIGSPVSVFNNTNYKGFGPTVGMDYSYDLMGGLSVTANGSGSILYGTTRYHEGFVLDTFHVIAAQVYASKKAIVPSLEAKLGLNYAYPMAQGTVNINAGYQVVNYFNPLAAQSFQNPASSINFGASRK